MAPTFVALLRRTVARTVCRVRAQAGSARSGDVRRLTHKPAGNRPAPVFGDQHDRLVEHFGQVGAHVRAERQRSVSPFAGQLGEGPWVTAVSRAQIAEVLVWGDGV